MGIESENSLDTLKQDLFQYVSLQLGAETDAAAGKHTLVVRFGRGFARAQFAGSHAVAVAAIPLWLAWRDHNAWRLLPVALAPLAWRHVVRLKRKTEPLQQIALLGDTGKLLALYAILQTAGLVL